MTSTVGIDVGGTKTEIVRLDDASVVASTRTATGRDAPVTVETVDAIRRVWSDDVTGIGAGLAGLVDFDGGRFVWGPHVAGTDVPVREILEDEFGVPAVVDNDVNAAAFGELRAGAGRGHRHLLMVTVGTGIGGAIVVDGEIHRGRGYAGEWGHMRFDPGGAACDCGRSGCWETVVSGPALERLARAHVDDHPNGPLARRLRAEGIDGEAVTRAAQEGDGEARRLVARVGASLGEGLGTLITIFDPEIVVVGGGLGSIGGPLLGPARRAAEDALHGAAVRDLPPVVAAELGSRANAVGAALLAARSSG